MYLNKADFKLGHYRLESTGYRRLPYQKSDAELTKYWLDRDGSRIQISCRIHLPTWFADLGGKHESDGL